MTSEPTLRSRPVDAPSVSFVGLGAIGAPMAARIAAALPLAVWARRESVTAAHSADHGSVAVRFDELARAKVLVLCLPSSVEVVEVLASLDSQLRRGTVVVDCTSGDPQVSRSLAARLAGRGIGFLDAPVSGGVSAAVTGELTAIVGGEWAWLERARPVIETFSAQVRHVGPVGAGHAIKAVNNAVMALTLYVTSEGLAALEAAGVDPEVALETINASSGRSVASSRHLVQRLSSDEPARFTLELMAKDVRTAAAIARRGLLASPALALADQLFDRLGRSLPHQDLLWVYDEMLSLVDLGRDVADTPRPSG